MAPVVRLLWRGPIGWSGLARFGQHRAARRRHLHARAHPLQAVDDDPLAGLEPGVDHAIAIHQPSQLDGRYSTVLSGLSTSTNFLSWSVPTARSRTTVAGSSALPGSLHAREQPGGESSVLVGEHRARPHRAAARIELVVDEVQDALVRECAVLVRPSP